MENQIEFYKKLRILWDDIDRTNENDCLVKKVTETITNNENILTELDIKTAMDNIINNVY